jgi:hypothetical protein
MIGSMESNRHPLLEKYDQALEELDQSKYDFRRESHQHLKTVLDKIKALHDAITKYQIGIENEIGDKV